MPFRESIVVDIIYKESGEKVTKKTVKSVEFMGNAMKRTTKIWKGGVLVQNKLTESMRKFRPELLSVMFFGMGLQRTIAGLTQTSMEWMGVNDVLSAFLGLVFLPIAEALLNIIFWLWDAFDALPQPVKDIIIVLTAITGIIGIILTTFASLSLGISGLALVFGMTAGAFITAALPIIGIVMAIIAIVAALYVAYQTNFMGFKDVTDSVFNFIVGKIQWGINAIQSLIQSAMDFISAIWQGRWGDAFNIVKDVFDRIWNFLGNLGGQFYNLAISLLQQFINGIVSMATAIGNAFWNILPPWIQNILKGIGGAIGTAATAVRGAVAPLFGMQEGGIVTRPTPALLGERRPEAVIPLDRIGSIGGINVTINTSSIGGNVDMIARELAEKFSFELGRVRY